MDFTIYFLALYLIAGYLLGSIPFGLVLCRVCGYGDIRKIGSGNIGATNVLRTGNKFLALVTLLLDSGKGAIAVLLAILSLKYVQAIENYGDYALALTGLGAVLGHIFPVWLGFKGGKGVATSIGTLLAISPITGLIVCLTWLVMALIFRISSLSALASMVFAPLAAVFYEGIDIALIVAIISVIVWARHSENIKRIINGTEPKIGRKKDKESKRNINEDKKTA